MYLFDQIVNLSARIKTDSSETLNMAVNYTVDEYKHLKLNICKEQRNNIKIVR